MRICFFGDSIVSGTGDDDCLGWTGRVCSKARRRGHDLTHYNLGIRRDTSADIRARWRLEALRRLLSEYDGRLAFAFGANDCLSETTGRVRVDRAETLANARSILSEAAAWLPTLMIGPAPVSFDFDVDGRVAALSRDLGDLCTSINVSYLPVFALLKASEVWCREAAEGDGTHPNSGGYSTLASIVNEWDPWKRWFSR
jgi:acyl-CoA thioesterase-1